MVAMATRFDSARQDWSTPDELWRVLDAEFRFTLDAAADASNAKCPEFIDESRDALTVPWGRHVVWLNPPYGAAAGNRLSLWVRKALTEASAGCTVVMLIPARTNTNWFHDLCLAHGEVRFVRGRPRFGDAPHGLPQPLCYVIFRPGAGR